MTKSILFLFALLSGYCYSQTPVALTPPPHLQFLDASGSPLAGGFLYTYQAGTTTLLNTYAEPTGTIQNPDPIPLDATGAPSNGTVQTNIWLANASYKICAFNSAMVPQWCTDNVTGYLGLLNSANTWTFTQTFTQPIVDTATDSQLVFGASGNQMIVDFPPPTGNQTMHFFNTSDTVVGRNTTDDLTNKTLESPVLDNPSIGLCPMSSPGTFACIPNASPTGPTDDLLVKLINTPSQATISTTSDLAGLVGICVTNCGLAGSASIQQSGLGTCSFDGSTTAGDYVQASVTMAAHCHDAGAAFPVVNQVIGRVLSTNSGAGFYQLEIFPPETYGAGTRAVLADFVSTIAGASSTGIQVLKNYGFQANVLNADGKAFRITTQFVLTPGSSINSTLYFAWGASSSIGTISPILAETSSSSVMTVSVQMNCMVFTAGSSGGLLCTPFVVTSAGTVNLNQIGVTTVDLTNPLFFGFACQFSAGSTSNTCAENQMSVEQLN